MHPSQTNLSDAQLYQKLLDGARRIEYANTEGVTSASGSHDCDYGHDLIEEVLTCHRNAAFVAGMAAARQQVVQLGWSTDETTPGDVIDWLDDAREDAIRHWESGEELFPLR